jgi:hypothetical protein
MKKAFKLIGIAFLLVAIVLSMAACSDDGGGDSGVNGTYVNGSEQVKLTNGKDFEVVVSGTSIMKGTFTTSGSSISVSISQVWGPAMNDVNTFETRWYTKNELIAAGVSSSMFTMTGSYTASTLTLTWLGETDSYTKSESGGTTPGGTTPGGGGTFTLTGIPSEYNGKYADLAASGGVTLWGPDYDGNKVRISNGRVSIPLKKLEMGPTWVPYTGNHTTDVAVTIYNRADGGWLDIAEFNSVTFANGSATRDWSEAR